MLACRGEGKKKLDAEQGTAPAFFLFSSLNGPSRAASFLPRRIQNRAQPLGSCVPYSSVRRKNNYEQPGTCARASKEEPHVSLLEGAAAAAISHVFFCFPRKKTKPPLFLTHPKNMASVTIARASSEGVFGHASAMRGGICVCGTSRPRKEIATLFLWQSTGGRTASTEFAFAVAAAAAAVAAAPATLLGSCCCCCFAAARPLRVSTTSHVDAALEELDVVGVAKSSSSIEVGVEGEAALLLLLLPSALLTSLPRKRCSIIWFCVIVWLSAFKCASVENGKKERKGKGREERASESWKR